MKKCVVLAMSAAAAIGSAQVFPSAFFPTAPFFIESYTTTANGAYTTFPMWSGFGTANRIGTGGLLNVGPPLVPLTPPRAMFGRGVDVEMTVSTPMRRFGGYFKWAQFGVFVNSARFNFYDASNNLIGSGIAPITAAWTWIGWRTIPKWKRVEIIASPATGYVAFDMTRIRP